MPDNLPIDPATGPNAAPVATDEIGGVHFQVVKVAHGADGTATPVTAAAPLPTADAALAAAIATLNAATAAIQAAVETLAGRTLDTSAVALDAPTLAALETVQVSNWPATQPVTAAALPLPADAATDATLQAINTLNDTLLYWVSAMLDKMPALTRYDTAMVQAVDGNNVPCDSSNFIFHGNSVVAASTLMSATSRSRIQEPWNFSDSGSARLYQQIQVS